MEWVLKASSWGFTEIGRDHNNNLASLTESDIDLGLGRLGDLGDETVDKMHQSKGSTIGKSPLGLSKRTRANTVSQKMSCLVEGCVSDLGKCREYHRRHRVCERHSKTPIVMVGGKEQRFCQQCSRFHCLGEFDEVKRSCRKRLDGHNRRRRKPQPETLYMSSQNFLSNHQGVRMLQFSGSQSYTTATGGSSGLTWRPCIDKHQHQQFRVVVQQNTHSNPFTRINKQFPFMLTNNHEKCNPSMEAALETTPDKLTHLVKPKRALSLLSTHPTQTLGAGLSHSVQPSPTRLDQHASPGMQFNTSDHCNWTFEFGPDALLENGASHQLPFSWN